MSNSVQSHHRHALPARTWSSSAACAAASSTANHVICTILRRRSVLALSSVVGQRTAAPGPAAWAQIAQQQLLLLLLRPPPRPPPPPPPPSPPRNCVVWAAPVPPSASTCACQIAPLAPRHTAQMAGARVSWLLPFLASTAALQLALSPCRAPALPRRAGAPCMKYSAINDLSLLLTDAEVSSLASRRVSTARLESRHPASPHTHTHTHTHTLYYNPRSRPPPASPI